MVWPEFDVSIVENNVDGESSETVMVSGIPENCLTTGDSARFTSDQLFIYFNVHTWHTRQREVWHQPPTASQEDFIFYNILRSLSVSDKLLDEPLIPYWPDSFHIPGLIRFLAGVEDFACRSAHYTLRSKMPSIANSIAKRSCLICLHDRKVVVDDTEWQLLFGCCATAEHRSKYFASLKDDPLAAASLPTSPSISTLVNHFLFARETSDNLRIFAQFVKDSLQARQRRLRLVQAQCPDSIFI